GDRHRVEIEIIEQAGIHADLGIVEIRLAGRPVRRLRKRAATAIGAKMMLDGLAAPETGRDVLGRCDQVELCRLVIGPQRPALGTDRTGAALDARWRLAHLELSLAAARQPAERRRPFAATCSR